MKVGDLIKVYSFSYKSRTEFRDLWTETDVDAHFVGLIGGAGMNHGIYRQVLRSDGDTEFYNLDRMEVINANR